MKLPDPDNYIDREDMIDEIVDEILFRIVSDDLPTRRIALNFITDMLIEGGVKPLIKLDDVELQQEYDAWVGGDLRLNSFYGDDQEAQLEMFLESRHG